MFGLFNIVGLLKALASLGNKIADAFRSARDRQAGADAQSKADLESAMKAKEIVDSEAQKPSDEPLTKNRLREGKF